MQINYLEHTQAIDGQDFGAPALEVLRSTSKALAKTLDLLNNFLLWFIYMYGETEGFFF